MALPVGAVSLDEADAAVELWEHYSGKTLDPGQRLDVAVMLATRADGTWAASVTGHEKPRQSGKGDSVEVVELWGLTQRNERILHTIHDAVLLATETQSRMLTLLDHPDLRRLTGRTWKGTGQQMIEMRQGGVIWYRTRTGAGGRGIDEVDRLVVDEAQHAEAQHLAAITPTQAVSANPQLNALGTGGLDGKSAWWWSLRKQAKGTPGAFAWVGWSAQPWTVDDQGRVALGEVDPFDRDLWWSTIPGLVAGRTSIEFLERELRVLGPEGFAQEYLCVWASESGTDAVHPVDLVLWEELGDEHAKIASHHQWSLAVSPDRRWASVAIAGRTSEGKLIGGFKHRRPTTEWVLSTVVEEWENQRIPIRIRKSGPESSFILPLRERGVEVVEVSNGEDGQACGQFIDAVNAGEFVHLAQPSLTKALRGAVIRPSSDGVSRWDQRSSSVEITPLVAVTCALGGVPSEAPNEWTGSLTDLSEVDLSDEEDEYGVPSR